MNLFLEALLMTNQSALTGRLTKWAILLSQYDMKFMPQKAIKGQVLANFLVNYSASKVVRMHGLLNDVAEVSTTQAAFDDQIWQLCFDGASRTNSKGNPIAGVEVVLVPPKKVHALTRILTIRAVYQQCGKIQCSAYWHEDRS